MNSSTGLPGTPADWVEPDHDQCYILESVKSRLADRYLRRFRRNLTYAIGHFDVLEGETVTVACRRDPDDPEHSRWNPYANADPVNRLIRIPTHEVTTNVTIWHELAHLAIAIAAENGADHPTTSEEFCSIYAVARMPPETIDENCIPYLGRPGQPREAWPETCGRALEYREQHGSNSHYIQRCKRWLEITS